MPVTFVPHTLQMDTLRPLVKNPGATTVPGTSLPRTHCWQAALTFEIYAHRYVVVITLIMIVLIRSHVYSAGSQPINDAPPVDLDLTWTGYDNAINKPTNGHFVLIVVCRPCLSIKPTVNRVGASCLYLERLQRLAN